MNLDIQVKQNALAIQQLLDQAKNLKELPLYNNTLSNSDLIMFYLDSIDQTVTLTFEHFAGLLGDKYSVGFVQQEGNTIDTGQSLRDAIDANENEITLQDIRIGEVEGLGLFSNQVAQEIYVKNDSGTTLSTLSVAFLNNEGTVFSYNDITEKLELKNDQGVLLAEVPVSAFVSNLAKTIALGGNKLDLKDTEGNILSFVEFGIGNIDGLQNALNLKVDKLAGSSLIEDTSIIRLANTSGSNTGDQDLSALATKANVLELDNTTSFTPDSDYEPATKKYVDNNVDTVPASFVKLTTTSTADLNPSSEMKIAWDTLAIDEKDEALTHSVSNNNSRITLDQDGYYRGFVNISFNSSVIRSAPLLRIKINDTTYLKEEAVNTYIRSTLGHNESSANFSFVVEANAGDYIEVTSIQKAAGGSVNIDNASFTIEKYEIGKQGEKGDIGATGIVDFVSNVATDTILGRITAGSGDSEELSISAVRTLINVEDGADVTDTVNVTASGALMDTEIMNLSQVKAFDASDYAAALGADNNYITDAEAVVIGNTSGTNTGDQDLSGKVDDSQVLTNVPVGAVFTDNDTVYDDTIISGAVDLNTAKVGITSQQASDITDNNAKETNITHPLVQTAVPAGALFTDTDTIYNDTVIQSEVTDNTNARHSHLNKPTLDKFGEDVDGKPTYNSVKVDTTIAQRDVYDGLDSTDNTISLAANQGKVLKDVQDTQQTEINLKAPKESPTFTGTVTLPIGTSGKIPKYTSAGVLGDSVITELPTGWIGVNEPNPRGVLDIKLGNANIYIENRAENPEFKTTNSKLYFSPAGRYTIFSSSTGSSTLQIEGSTLSQMRFYGAGSKEIITNNGDLKINPNSNLLINSDAVGNVGINNTTPTEKLDVNGNIKLSGINILGQYTTATRPAYAKGAQFFDTTINKMVLGGATAWEEVTSS